MPSTPSKGLTIRLAALTAFLVTLLVFTLSCAEGPVKEPSVAGSFYPGERAELTGKVDKYLKAAKPLKMDGKLLAIISPHAGYVYSGHVAAYGYKNLPEVDTVILIGSSHYARYQGASVYDKGSFRTPLGLVKVDEKLARRLMNEEAGVRFVPEPWEKEHSLEVQIPFLQRSQKRFKVVPVLMGSQTRASHQHLAKTLSEILAENDGAVIVASTDLSHYHDYETANSMDRLTTRALGRLSLAETQRLMVSREGEMCGAAAVLLTLDVTRRLGANQGVLYLYANSGDVTPDRDRVVGYASMGIYRTAFTKADREELLSIARDSIVEKIKTGKNTRRIAKSPRLAADAAVFVTINRAGKLRGCVGQTTARMPLYQAVQSSAIAACSADSRFKPMTVGEIHDMEVEVSILSPFMPVVDYNNVVVGRDGLIIVKDGRSGLLLPQVPVQQGWDRKRFLEQVSRKAGLPADAYKDGAELYRFTAEVIRDGI